MTSRAEVASWVRQQDSETLYKRVERYDNSKCMSCDRRTPCICKISEEELRNRYEGSDQEESGVVSNPTEDAG